MANLMSVRLNKGDAASWGFRLQGGKDFGTPLVIQKILGGSPAERAGLIAGDTVVKINNVDVYNLRHKDAQDVILRAGPSFDIAIQRGGSTWKPSVTPVGSIATPRPAAPISTISPVTNTSLAAGKQDSIDAIGTTHNLSAKPFQVNGGPKLVNKQYNSPLPLYSEQSIAETLSAQSELLSNGVLGVNFKKNEKNYDSSNSAVFRMVQEADKEPRDYEAEAEAASSGVVTAPLGIAGLRHVTAPETKPAPPTPQLQPGQNICADCERLIIHAVGGHTSAHRRGTPTSDQSQSINPQGAGFSQPEPEQKSSNAANQQMTKCTDCERVIVGVFVRIKDKNLHVECFKCSTCGTSLKNVGYYNLNNKLYCDVHAKLAARNNPPAPNLQPVTIPPGGRVPAGAISSALASHSLPSPAPAPLSPLLPSTNYSAAPYQPGGACFSSPRPFSSVSAPLSPSSSTLPKLSPTPAAPTAPLAGRYSSIKPSAPFRDSRSVQNLVWPPTQTEPEFPTASPLYFPPPSQVPPSAQKLLQEKTFATEIEEDYCESEEMSYIAQNTNRNLSLCSAEVFNITGRRSAAECTETIADTINTQILVESIMQSRPKSPPPIDVETTKPCNAPQTSKSPGDVSVTFTISEAKLKQGAYAKTESSLQDSNEKTESLLQGVNAKTGGSSHSAYGKTESSSQDTYAKTESLSQGAYSTTESSSICERTEFKSCLKEQKMQSLASMYEKKIKVENTVPHQWESSMVTALTTASDKPYSQIQSTVSNEEFQGMSKSDTFSQIPTKKSTSALASALATAPAEPFTPASTKSSLEPVSLPQETVPYFPPEHPIIIEPKVPKEDIEKTGSQFVEALKVAPEKPTARAPVKKKGLPKDEFFKDLPTPPAEKITMLAALTTAPDRPYSPFISESASYQTTISESNQLEQVESIQKKEECKNVSTASLVKRVEPAKKIINYQPTAYTSYTNVYQSQSNQASQCASTSTNIESVQSKEESKKKTLEKSSKSELLTTNIQSTEDVTKVPAGLPPVIQLVRSTYESNTDKVQMEMSCQFLGDAIAIPKQIIEKSTTSKTDVLQEQSVEKSITEEKIKQQEIARISQQKTEQNQSQQDLKRAAFARTAILPCAFSTDLTESALLQKATTQAKSEKQLIAEKSEHSEAVKSITTRRAQIEQIPLKERITVIQPGQTNLVVPEISFQPVSDEGRPSTKFSPRPRPITPSMINKPAPVLPHYQASLVAMQCAAVETNLLDPTSPTVSRSPSPYPGRPGSPFPSSSGRAVSPAPGPPPNPLQSHKSLMELKNEGKMQQARSYVQNYIPQHQSMVINAQSTGYQAEKLSGTSQKCVARTSSDQKHSSSAVKQSTQSSEASSAIQQSKQQQFHEMASINSKNIKYQTSDDRSVQIQKKKQITEEYQQTRKSNVYETSKFSSNTQMTNAPVIEDQGVVGFHLTNPQPLKSPFITANGAADTKSVDNLNTQFKPTQKLPQVDCCQQPAPYTAPKLTKAPSLTSGSVPTTSSSSNVNVTRPNTSQPNAGTGGGRQAGAIGVAPKRGRGILNLATTPGSRVPLCGSCHSHIRGPFVTALGKIWCPDHFVCATPSCKRPLHDLGFVEEHGQLYCEYCFEQYLAPPCAKCSSKVKGDCLKAIGKNFHPECFSCVYCGKLFGNSPFFLEDAQPYCEADWNELFTTKCFACGFPVEAGDRWVEALNNNYHSQCFNCTMCKKNLEGQSFFAKGGRPFCKNHAR